MNELEVHAAEDPADVLRKTVPGRIYPWVRRASWVELAVFAGLIVVWLAPGLDKATFYFGLAHGVGYVALVILIWIAILRHEAPYILLAATLTPVGPVGSVIAIEYLDRKHQRELEARTVVERDAAGPGTAATTTTTTVK